MITSEIVSSESPVKNFLFCREVMSVLKIFSFLHFNHLMIYQICDVMKSISTWDKVHFRKYFLSHSWLSHQTWSIDISPGNNFQKSFEQFGGVAFNLTTCSNYWMATYIKIPMFHIFAKVNKGHLKMVNFYYWKWLGTCFQSRSWVKIMLEMFIMEHATTWINFILTVHRIEKK